MSPKSIDDYQLRIHVQKYKFTPWTKANNIKII